MISQPCIPSITSESPIALSGQWVSIMSPHQGIPALRQPTPSQHMTPNQLPQRHLFPNTNTHQPTLWSFIQKKLPPLQNPHATLAPTNSPQPYTATPTPTQTPPDPVPEQMPDMSQTNSQAPLQTHSSSNNDAWGEAWAYTQPHDLFQVVSKNLGMLCPYSLDMLAIASELNLSNSSIFLTQETNTAWKPATLQAIKTQCN